MMMLRTEGTLLMTKKTVLYRTIPGRSYLVERRIYENPRQPFAFHNYFVKVEDINQTTAI